MLINKGHVGDTMTFKLVNGDEIVAKLIEETGTGYVLAKPCTVLPSAKGIGLVQTLFTANPDSDITISKEHVMIMSPTIKAMCDHYIQTTTGIQPVNAGGIIT